jgi:hypothetical protein
MNRTLSRMGNRHGGLFVDPQGNVYEYLYGLGNKRWE